MTDGILDKRGRRLEAFEILLRQQHVPAIIRQQRGFLANEQHAALPLGRLLCREQGRLLAAVIPGQPDNWLCAARRILVTNNQPGWRRFSVNRGTVHRFNRERTAQLQCPMRQVHIMTAEVRQRAAAEGPPVPPFDWQVFRAVGPIFRRSQPPVVMKVGRY